MNNFSYSSFNNNNNNNNNDKFLLGEFNHMKKVDNKIYNMKIKQINDLQKNLTFKPKINENNNKFIQVNKNNNMNKAEFKKLKKNLLNNNKNDSFNNSNNSTFIKLYNDANASKTKKIEEKILSDSNNLNFSPRLYKNKKYVVSDTFSERQNKSVEKKNKYAKLNQKSSEKKVINWNKVYADKKKEYDKENEKFLNKLKKNHSINFKKKNLKHYN